VLAIAYLTTRRLQLVQAGARASWTGCRGGSWGYGTGDAGITRGALAVIGGIVLFIVTANLLGIIPGCSPRR